MRDSAVFPRVERPTSEGPRDDASVRSSSSITSDALRALAAELRGHCLLLPRGHLVYIDATAILAVADRLDGLAAASVKVDS